MKGMFTIKPTEFFYLQPAGHTLLILGCRIISPLAFTAGQRDNFSYHNNVPIHALPHLADGRAFVPQLDPAGRGKPVPRFAGFTVRTPSASRCGAKDMKILAGHDLSVAWRRSERPLHN